MTLALTLAGAALILAYAYQLDRSPLFAVDATVPYGPQRWPNPNSRNTPMTTDTTFVIPTELDDSTVGDIVNAETDPLHPDLIGEPARVYIDLTSVRTHGGKHALVVDLPGDGNLNAAQAEELRLTLADAVPLLAQLEGLKGTHT